MNLKRFVLFATLMLLGLGLSSSGLLAQEADKWTFMVYAIADNDLEPFMYGDLIEMQSAASTDEVNVVIQVDRAEGYDDGYGNWTDTRRFHITPGVNEPQAIENIGEINGGDPQNLVNFVTWTMANYPAEHYALVIWSHGGGWLGIGPDQSSLPGMLSLPEITQALAEIQSSTGLEKFDIIGFDACLMSQLEVLSTLAPYAHYSLAAEETIPGGGWAYVAPLTALAQNPDLTAPELGQIIIDSYMTYYGEVVSGYGRVDLHMVDLSKIESINAALNDFSTIAQENAEAIFTAIGQARNSAQIFAANTPDEAAYFASTDLINFMELFSEQNVPAELTAAVQAVQQAASESIVYSRASAALPNANGISIYFPFNSDFFSLGGNVAEYPQMLPPGLQGWNTFLNNFHDTTNALLDPTSLVIDIHNVVLNNETSSIYDPPVIQFRSDGQGVIGLQFIATYIAEDGTKIILEQTPLITQTINDEGLYVLQDLSGEQDIDYQWRAEIPYISDGEVRLPALLLLPSGQPSQATVSGVYYNQAGERIIGYLEYDLNTQKVATVWGIVDAGDGTVIPFEIRPTSGDTFAPTMRFLDEDGEIVLFELDEKLTFSDVPFTFEYQPAISGEYELTVILNDMAGNVATSTYGITVNNEGLDPAYRGFEDVYNGFTFLYPALYPEPDTVIGSDDGVQYYFQDETISTFVLVRPYFVSSAEEMLEIAQVTLNDYALDSYVVGEPEAVEGDGYTGYTFGYEFISAEGEQRYGIVLAAYSSEFGMGISVDMDTNEEASQAASEAFNTMITTLKFFAPVAEITEE